jgi:hypothetical protein
MCDIVAASAARSCGGQVNMNAKIGYRATILIAAVIAITGRRLDYKPT